MGRRAGVIILVGTEFRCCRLKSTGLHMLVQAVGDEGETKFD